MRGGVKALQSIRTELKNQSLHLIKVLQSEITHEVSSPSFQNGQTSPPEDFTLEWDATNTQDIVLRKRSETGEEVAVSALLSDFTGDSKYPRGVLMKVCIKKPGLSSFMQFDCGVSHGSDFNIRSARYLQSNSMISPKYYTGPKFSELDPDLQVKFREYLEARGIRTSLMNFLLHHMHKKEQNQYVDWLHKVVETVS